MGSKSLEKMVRDGLESMPRAQRRRMVEAIQGVIDEQVARDAGTEPEVLCCPRCGSASFHRDGHDAAGKQRHRCNDCGRRFVRTRRSVIGSSKLDPSVWKRYAECLVDMLTLRDAASRCGVSLKTSFTMRHRLIEVIAAFSPAFAVGDGCGCQIDETYYPESYPAALAKLGVAVHDAYDSRAHKINRINAVHSALAGFMGRFRGVSTRRLWLYMAWFKWRWSFSTQTRTDMVDLALAQAVEGSYSDTRRDLADTPYLFMDYYGWA